MINFICKNNAQFGTPLTFEELDRRRRQSPKRTLILWGYLHSFGGELIGSKIRQITITNESYCKRLVNKSRSKIYPRYIAFTKRSRAEKFLKEAKLSDSENLDRSYYFTEIYD